MSRTGVTRRFKYSPGIPKDMAYPRDMLQELNFRTLSESRKPRKTQNGASAKRSKSCPPVLLRQVTYHAPVTMKYLQPKRQEGWMDDTLKQIADYFKEDPKSAQLLDNGKVHQPMSTDVFIEMLNFLFENSGLNFTLSINNYAEQLNKFLIRIGYRGFITAFIIQNVDLPYSASHIIALISWVLMIHRVSKCLAPVIILDCYIPTVTVKDLYREIFKNITDEDSLEFEFVRRKRLGLKRRYSQYDNKQNSDQTYNQQAVESWYESLCADTDEDELFSSKETVQEAAAQPTEAGPSNVTLSNLGTFIDQRTEELNTIRLVLEFLFANLPTETPKQLQHKIIHINKNIQLVVTRIYEKLLVCDEEEIQYEFSTETDEDNDVYRLRSLLMRKKSVLDYLRVKSIKYDEM